LNGNLLIANFVSNQLVSMAPDGATTVIAGIGSTGFSGDGGPATAASLNVPQGIAVDAKGVIYIADENNFRVRKITTDGTINTVLGPMTGGFRGIALDRQGNLYVTSYYGNCIQRLSSTAITTIAGQCNSAGF